MADLNYIDMLSGVEGYYDFGFDEWGRLVSESVTSGTVDILSEVPGVEVVTNISGTEVLGIDYQKSMSAIKGASDINSNVQGGLFSDGGFSAKIPGSAYTDSAGATKVASGAKIASTGAKLATVADKLSLAVVGVSLGTKLGKLIDSALYNANPEFWDEHLPSLNPETWDNLATSEGGKTLIRSIFGLQGDTTTPYVDERLLAYVYQTLLDAGAYSSGDTYEYHGSTAQFPIPSITSLGITHLATTSIATEARIVPDNDCILIATNSGNYIQWWGYSLNPNSGYTNYWNDGRSTRYKCSQTATTYNGKTFYHTNSRNTLKQYVTSVVGVINPTVLNVRQSGTIIFDGSITPTIEGITDDPDAETYITPSTVINPTTGVAVTPQDDVDDVVQALRTAYPDIFTGDIYEDVPQSDGTIKRIYYVPTPLPDTTNVAQPTTGIYHQTTPELSPEVSPETDLQTITTELTDAPSPPDTGEGNSPTLIIPEGSAQALFTIYNPSQSELDTFGGWLWSSSFVDQLLKMFNDPMQAIIGLHKVFCPVPVSGTDTIHVGYLDSGVTSNVVNGQYATVDCGSVSMSEFFGSVFDYEPFTEVSIYLPFIGFQQLDVGEVMRSTISVKYHVDVLTGACLAEVSVKRDNAGGVLYTYLGNCAVSYPLSSGSYMGLMSGLLSVAGGIVGSIASGGALLPVALGAVNSVMSSHTNVQHSGSYSANAGAMGIKKPYLVITRPQTKVANNSPNLIGYATNSFVKLSASTGLTKISYCHIEGITATDTELSEIEALLKDGVIV